MIYFLCVLLGMLIAGLIRTIISFNKFEWDNELVADFTWHAVKGVLTEDNDMFMKLIEAHKNNDEECIKEIEEKIIKRIKDVAENK